MAITQSLNSRSLRVADQRSYFEKVVRYGHIGGHSKLARMRQCPVVLHQDIETDGAGNILKMPPLIGRPCFGIPTAYLRERCVPPKFVPALKVTMPTSKCIACNAQRACHAVIVERLSYVQSKSGTLVPLLQIWRDEGGFTLNCFQQALDKLGPAPWKNITYALQKFIFLSSNVQAINEYWDAEEKRCVSVARSAAIRIVKAEWRKGDSLSSLTAGLDIGGAERVALLQTILATAATPRYLTYVSAKSIDRIAFAWWGREYAKLTGKKDNPNSIAKILIAANLNLKICESSLRSSVKFDLLIIKKLEAQAKYNGGAPIWPKFSHPALVK